MASASAAAEILILVMVSKSSVRRLPAAAAEPHANAPLLVDVLAIVVAHEFDHLVVTQAAIRQRVDDGLLQDDRIVDGDLVMEDIGCQQLQSLGDAHLVAVRNVLV